MVGIQHLPGFHKQAPALPTPVPAYDPTPTTLNPVEAQTMYASGRTSTIIDKGAHRLLTASQQAELIGRLSSGITSGASEKQIMTVLRDATTDGRLDALLQGLNKSRVSGTMVGSLLDMRKAEVMRLVADTSGVAGSTAKDFLGQLRPADVTEVVAMPAEVYAGYVGLLQDVRAASAKDLEATKAEWPALIGKLPFDPAAAICSQALVRTDLTIPTKLLILEFPAPGRRQGTQCRQSYQPVEKLPDGSGNVLTLGRDGPRSYA